MVTKSVNGIEEIYEISKRLESQREAVDSVNKQQIELISSLDEKISVLENKVEKNQAKLSKLSEHYHEFVRATVEYLRENAED